MNGERAPKDWFACPYCAEPLHPDEHCGKCGLVGVVIEYTDCEMQQQRGFKL